jgi:hypothetical protein
LPAAIELAETAAFAVGMRVLDVAAGLGRSGSLAGGRHVLQQFVSVRSLV